MKILFCWPAAHFSVSDMARGLRGAMVRAGHDIRDYRIDLRWHYHARAMGKDFRGHIASVSKQASENIVVEALRGDCDLVVIVSALMFHPEAIALLRKVGIKLAVWHSESPYHDADQAEWSEAYPEAVYFTHERSSAKTLGWNYLPHAYDPHYHHPVRSIRQSDVCFLGTGWKERIELLEGVNWDGIDVKLYGIWPELKDDSPLRRFYVEGVVDNERAPEYYCGAKINLNMHRKGDGATSLNPRGYELAACKAFTLTDARADGVELFGDSQVVFDGPQQLEFLIRQYLADPVGRKRHAARAFEAVQPETFDARLQQMMAVVERSAAVEV